MITIEDTDFHSAWSRAVRAVLRDGNNIVIGNKKEPKPILDSAAVIELTGNAIKQIEDREIHPQFPFRLIDNYCAEFTYEFDHTRFVYTYFDRLVNREVNQLISLKENLSEEIETGISSNRHQAVTWNIGIDHNNPASPCLQRIWIRYAGDNNVDVHLTWRSRDLFTAWQANIVAIIDMLNREVIRPNNCRIVKLVDFCNSLHIYKSDIAAAEKVKLVSPANFGRL